MGRSTAKTAMIEAAETLIAERGLGSVSLRDVQTAAGQRNKSAAQYHFGTKDGLVQAILSHRMGPINDERTAMLDHLDATASISDMRALVQVLVDPLVNCSVALPRSGYARFLARVSEDPSFLPLAREAIENTSYQRWRAAVGSLLQDLPRELGATRIDRVVAMTIQTLAVWESGRGRRGLSLGVLIADLVETGIGVLCSPAPRTSERLESAPAAICPPG